MQIRHFCRFRQNGPFFLAGEKNTVYQKHGLCHPESGDRRRFGRTDYWQILLCQHSPAPVSHMLLLTGF